LLDPADPEDPLLISFDMEGHTIVTPGCTDPWEIQRVKYSVERYYLDFPALMDKRKVLWNECWNRIQQYLKELNSYKETNSLIAKDQAKEKAKQIRAMLHEKEELSSVARACVIGTGDPRVVNLLQSM
jgi:hypothetical protein